MTEFTSEQLAVVRAFLAQVRERASVGDKERVDVRVYRLRTGIWGTYDLSEIDILAALWWYRFRHKPGSREWRPAVITRALITAAERDYAEPERIEPNDAALNASPAVMKQARKAFIEKHGVATFYQKIKPILARRRCGGVKALFQEPATMETRDYVAILASLAGREERKVV